MKKTVHIAVYALLASCSSIKDMTHAKAGTPPPTHDLFAFGTHYTERGATEIATESAEEFCYRWRMVPAIKNKQTAERGVLPGSALEEIASHSGIPPWSPSKAKWETRIIYTCM